MRKKNHKCYLFKTTNKNNYGLSNNELDIIHNSHDTNICIQKTHYQTINKINLYKKKRFSLISYYNYYFSFIFG